MAQCTAQATETKAIARRRWQGRLHVHELATICQLNIRRVQIPQQSKDGSDSTSETDEKIDTKNRGFLSLAYGTAPPADQVAVDDEYLLMREVSDETSGSYALDAFRGGPQVLTGNPSI